MKKGNFNKLLFQLFILSLPLLCILITFFAFDPYGYLLPLEQKQKALIPLSDDYIAVERYLKYNPEKNYNSFTFGNSKTLAYLTSDWCEMLPNCNGFKFGVPGECIYNIYNKLKLIDANQGQIKNAILVFDSKVFLNFKNTQKFFQGPAYIHHPYSMDGSWIGFYSSYLKFYFSDFAFLQVIKYKLTGNYEPAMNEIFKNPNEYEAVYSKLKILPLTNEVINTGAEAELEADSASYFELNKSKFTSRLQLKSENSNWNIKKEDIEYMQEMVKIFKKHNTNFKIILGPNFDQIPFPKKQKDQLIALFGAKNIFDFTGINSLTNRISNYYESSHYRTKVGKAVLTEIYK